MRTIQQSIERREAMTGMKIAIQALSTIMGCAYLSTFFVFAAFAVRETVHRSDRKFILEEMKSYGVQAEDLKKFNPYELREMASSLRLSRSPSEARQQIKEWIEKANRQH